MRILILLTTMMTTAFAQGPAFPDQGAPPTNLTRRADGRFSANSDPTNPERYEVHVVVAGDTLSAIAGKVLNNPRLWPQLWEQNEHVVNPHWIYPNDKILIRPITQITEAAPPPPPDPAPAAAPAPPPPARTTTPIVAQIQAETPPSVEDLFVVAPPPNAPEIKLSDLYCSGSIRTQPVSDDLKVISKFRSDGGAIATATDYIYLGQGTAQGVRVGDMYQVIRPTKDINSPSRPRGQRDRGKHYLDVAQIRVVIAQAEFALARVIHSCEGVELGDIMIPFQRIEIAAPPRPRPFSPFMAPSGQVPGNVIATKAGLSNFGSIFKGSGTTPGIRTSGLSSLERGLATEGTIAYLDLGEGEGVRPGDIFIVFRTVELDTQLYKLPSEADKLRDHREAIGELIVLKVGERASTALVTYATDALALGDSVERR